MTKKSSTFLHLRIWNQQIFDIFVEKWQKLWMISQNSKQLIFFWSINWQIVAALKYLFAFE